MLRWGIASLAAAVLLLCAPAQAATVNINGSVLVFLASPNETNHLTISADVGTKTMDFSDSGASLLSSSCTRPGGSPHHLAECSPFGITGDVVSLLDGDDYLLDNVGPLQALGGDGADSLFGSPQNDQLYGGPGNDRLYGDAGNDLISDGGESLNGGDDRLRGGDGSDTPGSGDDTLDGGNMVDGSGAGSDLMDGADGFDTADYSQRTAPLKITDADAPGGTDVNVGNDGQAGEQDNVVNIEHLIGGSAADVLSAGGASSVLEGAAGNDILIGGPWDDKLYGGWAGPDEANASAGEDTLGTGNDTFEGGPGADMFHGGDGTDTVTYAGRTTPVTVTLNGLADDGGPGEHDNVLGDIEVVVGGAGADKLMGNSAANTLNGGGGADKLSGQGGDDVLIGGAGNDTLTGGTGDDKVSGGGGNDTIFGRDSSPDTISCGPGADTVYADPVDVVASDCEHVLLPPGTRTGPAKVSLPALVAFHHGAARIRLDCPATVPGGCGNGRLSLIETAPHLATLTSARFTIAAGDHVIVVLRIKAQQLRALRRVKHLRVKLTATASDVHHHVASASRAVRLQLDA